MNILSVVGARPNFMKVAPIHAALVQAGFGSRIVHTGQHYDVRMSDVFFAQLGLPEPDAHLGVGSGSHAFQTARIMETFDDELSRFRPDGVVVVGDVNSTVACTLVAVKRGIPVAHVEAGLRSGDRSMPEEINRIVTDSISDLLFVSEPSGMANLLREGRPPEITHFVGNVMIDSLVMLRQRASESNVLAEIGLNGEAYGLVTIHRPANVDSPEPAGKIRDILMELADKIRIVFPMHPRTRASFSELGLLDGLVSHSAISVIEPQGYLEFLNLMQHATLVLTDSGGIQEETTYLGVPCLTIRDSTERPITVEIGTNQLIPLDAPTAIGAAEEILGVGPSPTSRVPDLWDGSAASRVVKILGDEWA